MRPIARGAILALIMTVAAVPSAQADETTGGTPLPAATPAATAEPAPEPTVAVSETKTVSLNRSQAKRVQRKVHVRADGSVGRRTRQAISRYQQRQVLKRTGRPNLETLRKMRMPFTATIERRLVTRATTLNPSAPGEIAPAIAAARAWIGTPYQNAGTTTRGFDCSGLTVRAYQRAGISLPRTSFEQYREGTSVAKADIQPGDLVFFSTAGRGASHVGIATGATKIISATSSGVREHRIDDSYWGRAYVGARRITAS